MVAKHAVITCTCVLLSTSGAMAEGAPLAELKAAETTGAGISVTVATGGCTEKSDFEAGAQPAAKGAANVEIRRLKRDDCKGNFPAGLKLLFTWNELKLPAGTKLHVKNPMETKASVVQAGHKTIQDTPASDDKPAVRKKKPKRIYARHRRVKMRRHRAACE